MLLEMKDIINDMFSLSWPIVIISMVVAISLRIVYLIINKEKFVLYKELINLFFMVYILCLFQVVTYKDVSLGGTNYIPFKEILRYDFGSYLFIKNILGNMLLFLPFGFFVGYILKIEKTNLIVVLSFITSLTIEVTQKVIGRVFDVDDILLNVIGALVGFLIYKLGRKLYLKVDKNLEKEWILNVITVIVVVLVVRFILL